jgi:hypothetical protein
MLHPGSLSFSVREENTLFFLDKKTEYFISQFFIEKFRFLNELGILKLHAKDLLICLETIYRGSIIANREWMSQNLLLPNNIVDI